MTKPYHRTDLSIFCYSLSESKAIRFVRPTACTDRARPMRQPVRHSSACSKKNEAPLCFCEEHRPHMTANSIRLTMSREMRKPIRPTIRNKAGKRVRLNVM